MKTILVLNLSFKALVMELCIAFHKSSLNCAAKVLFSRCWGLSTRVEDHKDVLLIHRTRHNTRDTRLANTLKHAHILAGSLHTPLQQLLKIQIRGHKTSKAVFPFSCHFTEKQAADTAILSQYILSCQKRATGKMMARLSVI